MKAVKSFLLIILLFASSIFAQSDDEKIIRTNIENFYFAFQKKDEAGLKQFWKSDSQFSDEFFNQIKSLFAQNETVSAQNLKFSNSAFKDEIFRQRISIEIQKKPQSLTFLFVKENEIWKIWRIRPSEEDLMFQMINAENDEERNKLLSDNSGLQNSSLCGLIAYILFELGDAGKIALGYKMAEVGFIVAKNSDDKKCYGRMIYRRGLVTFSKGEIAEATKEYFNALEYAKQNDDKALEAIALYYIAIAYGSQNNFKLSLEYLNKASVLAEELNHIPLKRQILNLRAINTTDLKERFSALNQLLKMQQEAGNTYGEAATLGNIAFWYSDTDSHEKAIETMEIAVKKFGQIGFKNELIEAFMGLSSFNSFLGRDEIALDWSEKAYQIALETGKSPANPLNQKFHLNRKKGNLPEAKKNALEAIKYIEEARPKLLSDTETQTRFLKGQAQHYENLTLILSELKENEDALKSAELFKGRVLFDIIQTGKPSISKALSAEERTTQTKLKQSINEISRELTRENQREYQNKPRIADLEKKLGQARLEYEDFQLKLYATKPELRIRRGEFQPISLDEISALFPDEKTAFLEFAVTGGKTFLYVITKNGGKPSLQIYPIELKKEDLQKQVGEFHKIVSDSAINLNYKEPARKLFDLLLKPASARLRGKTSLIIIPDSFLWEIPFQALITAENRFLIEDFDITYAPSLTVLREMQKKPRKFSASPTLLAFGNPRFDSNTATILAEKRGAKLGDLPSAEKEVDFLGKLYGAKQSKIYKRISATETVFKEISKDFDILHFATHGILDNENPMYSAIVLSAADKSGEDGLLEVWELAEMNLDSDLAVLSACETGRGAFVGEGIVGLSWAFFIAGVPRVVASQWKVESVSTAELMTEFHRNLRVDKKKSVAKSLQTAMQKQLKNPRFRHPFYWSGFVSIGRD